jgi:hypothetical protein
MKSQKRKGKAEEEGKGRRGTERQKRTTGKMMGKADIRKEKKRQGEEAKAE